MSTAFSFDTREYRNALGRFATGVTVISAFDDGRPHGMTANAFASVSLEPPLVLVSVDHRANMHRILPIAGRYGISILEENQEPWSNHFAGRPQPGLQPPFFTRGDVPLLEGAVAYFVTRIVDMHPAGDHTLYIAQVEAFENRGGRPLLFHAGKYGRLPAGV